MADVVQYRLERMVNELEDLEKRGIFSRREIAEIVKQRRKFEYRLKRRSPLKQDFIAYIEYESQLDALRRLRKKALVHELKRQGEKNVKMKTSLSDYASLSRISELYRLAVMRFKGDVELWFRYLEFCRQKKNGRMRKVLAQVIRFHPKVPGVWIYAAAWEFDHESNVEAARALMQSGLRMCPNSEDLWVEYLRMELTYLNKLKTRKVVLGEDKGSLVREKKDANEKQWREQNEDLFMFLNEEKGNDEESNEESEKKLDLFLEHGSSILKTVYEGAIEAIPSSFSLRKRFLEIMEEINLPHSEDMRKEILSDMKRDFATDSEYWDWLARLEMPDPISSEEIVENLMPSQFQKAVQVYEEAVKTVPSVEMFNLYTKFFMDIISAQREATQASGLSSHTSGYILHTLKVYEKAESMGCLSEELASQYISFYVQIGKVDEALQLAEKLCSGSFSDSVQVWLLRVSLEMTCVTKKSSSVSKDDMQSIFGLLEGILTKFPVSEAESLWLMGLKFFVSHKNYFKKLVDISIISVTKDGGSENGFSLPSAVVSFVLQKDGLQRARETYKRFFALPRPGLALYRKCIELESNLAYLGDKDCLENARKLYDAALTTYSQNINLWQDYYSMEAKLGTSETAAAIEWRARKTVKDSALVFASLQQL